MSHRLVTFLVLVASLCLFGNASLRAEPHTLNFQVIDSETKQPLPDVTLKMDGSIGNDEFSGKGKTPTRSKRSLAQF